jgi:hypothetical protein
MNITNIFRQSSLQDQAYQPLLPSSPRGQAYQPPNPTNSGTGGSSSSRQPGEIQQPLPTQTTNTQNGKSHSKTSDKLEKILNILENDSSHPNTITASIKEISNLGVHNTPTSIRFFTKIGNNNSQQYNLAHPRSSGIANHQLVLLNKIVTKLIEIKNKNEELKANVVDCLFNTHRLLIRIQTDTLCEPFIGQRQVRSTIIKQIECDSEAVVRCMLESKFEKMKYASRKFQSDRAFVMEVVKQYGGALRYAAEELRRDREVVMEAVKKNGYALQYAAEELRRDREVVLEAVKKNGYALRYAADELRRDRDVVMESVRQDRNVLYGSALQYASEELRRDREVVMEAVKKDGSALQYASEELRGDRQVVMEAVKQNAWALRYASEELRRDRDVVMEAVKQNGHALQYASKELKRDRQVVMEAVNQNAWALQYASE